MKSRYLVYSFISLLFLIPAASFAGTIASSGGLFATAETDTTNF